VIDDMQRAIKILTICDVPNRRDSGRSHEPRADVIAWRDAGKEG